MVGELRNKTKLQPSTVEVELWLSLVIWNFKILFILFIPDHFSFLSMIFFSRLLNVLTCNPLDYYYYFFRFKWPILNRVKPSKLGRHEILYYVKDVPANTH